MGLLEAVEMAREQLNPAGMVAGLREIAKLQGYYAPTTTKVALDVGAVLERERLGAMSDGELFATIEELSAVIKA
nr:hypothetical protein [uncultured bacterium]